MTRPDDTYVYYVYYLLYYFCCLTINIVERCSQARSVTQRAKTGSTFRKTITEKKITVAKGRNWTDLETESFCRILVDPETNFATTLETKALKKTANKEVFEVIQCEFKISILEEAFAKENRLYFDIGDDDSFPELDISVPKLSTTTLRNNGGHESIVLKTALGYT